jgi:hypothetical protein
MRLTSTGLGIGTSSPTSKLNVSSTVAGGSTIAITLSDSTNTLNAQLIRTGSTYSYAGVGALETWLYSQGTSNLSLGPDGAGAVKFVTNGSERARIDPSGNFLVGTTTNVVAGAGHFSRFNADLTYQFGVGVSTTQTTGAAYFVNFVYNGSEIGSISTTAGSVTLYNTTSDQRLKTDLGQVTSTNVIDSTIVHDFIWKSDGTQSRGVFAQEAHKVIPSAVKVGDDGEKVEDVWAVDYSKYVPDLIVYCQQLKAEIQSLKAEVATLKGV